MLPLVLRVEKRPPHVLGQNILRPCLLGRLAAQPCWPPAASAPLRGGLYYKILTHRIPKGLKVRLRMGLNGLADALRPVSVH